jgi:hypothetical protein
MSFIAKDHSVENGTTFLIPEGPHVATVFAVIGLGLQETFYGPKPRVMVGFEIHDHRFQWEKDGQEHDEPATVWVTYNVSMHKNANLRIDIENLRGRTLSKDEAKAFDLFRLVGKSCAVTIEHNTAGERTYNNVHSVAQVMPGTEVPPLEEEEIRYLQPGQIGDLNLIPEFIRKKIDSQIKSDPNPEEVSFNEDEIPC